MTMNSAKHGVARDRNEQKDRQRNELGTIRSRHDLTWRGEPIMRVLLYCFKPALASGGGFAAASAAGRALLRHPRWRDRPTTTILD
jgi:hypothetical protein